VRVHGERASAIRPTGSSWGSFTRSSSSLVSANYLFTVGAVVREDVHGAAHGVLRRPDDDDVLAAHGIDVAARENATGSEPPVYSRLDVRGFLGLYYETGGRRGGRVLSFDTFVHNLTGVLRRMTLDDDGKTFTRVPILRQSFGPTSDDVVSSVDRSGWNH